MAFNHSIHELASRQAIDFGKDHARAPNEHPRSKSRFLPSGILRFGQVGFLDETVDLESTDLHRLSIVALAKIPVS